MRELPSPLHLPPHAAGGPLLPSRPAAPARTATRGNSRCLPRQSGAAGQEGRATQAGVALRSGVALRPGVAARPGTAPVITARATVSAGLNPHDRQNLNARDLWTHSKSDDRRSRAQGTSGYQSDQIQNRAKIGLDSRQPGVIVKIWMDAGPKIIQNLTIVRRLGSPLSQGPGLP